MIVKTRHGAFQQKSNKFKRQQEQQLQRILGQRLYNRVMARLNENQTNSKDNKNNNDNKSRAMIVKSRHGAIQRKSNPQIPPKNHSIYIFSLNAKHC